MKSLDMSSPQLAGPALSQESSGTQVGGLILLFLKWGSHFWVHSPKGQGSRHIASAHLLLKTNHSYITILSCGKPGGCRIQQGSRVLSVTTQGWRWWGGRKREKNPWREVESLCYRDRTLGERTWRTPGSKQLNAMGKSHKMRMKGAHWIGI